MLRLMFPALLLFFVMGCANQATTPSQDYAGITSIEIDEPDGRRWDLKLGKEYDRLKVTVEWENDRPNVEIDASKVAAFEGQRISAQAVVMIQELLSSLARAGIEITPEIASTVARSVLGGMLLVPTP